MTDLIPEIWHKDHTLGRHVDHDPRSKDWDFRSVSPEGLQDTYRIRDSLWVATGLPLNQKSVGKCTAEGLCGCLDTTPNWKPDVRYKPYDDTDSDRLYEEETKEEGWPWPQYDPGGTGVAVCKAAKKLGWITSYRHTFSLNHALHALNFKPVMIGINWYDSFDRPTSSGELVISPNAIVRGGHELFLLQCVVDGQLVTGWNSWGPDWGPIGGKYSLSWSTFDRLLHEKGDVTVPIP
jgi:hypothetical protein